MEGTLRRVHSQVPPARRSIATADVPLRMWLSRQAAQGSPHQPEKARAEQGRKLHRREIPLRTQRWSDDADCGGIETVGCDDKETEAEHDDLEWAERARIDEVLNIDGRGRHA